MKGEPAAVAQEAFQGKEKRGKVPERSAEIMQGGGK